MATVTLKGQPIGLAPLKSLQVAAFFEDVKTKGTDSSTANALRSLRVIAQSLANAGTPQGATIDEAIAAVDDGILYTDVESAFKDVMELTGIPMTAKATTGEAPAAVSTTGESSAAS